MWLLFTIAYLTLTIFQIIPADDGETARHPPYVHASGAVNTIDQNALSFTMSPPQFTYLLNKPNREFPIAAYFDSSRFSKNGSKPPIPSANSYVCVAGILTQLIFADPRPADTRPATSKPSSSRTLDPAHDEKVLTSIQLRIDNIAFLGRTPSFVPNGASSSPGISSFSFAPVTSFHVAPVATPRSPQKRKGAAYDFENETSSPSKKQKQTRDDSPPLEYADSDPKGKQPEKSSPITPNVHTMSGPTTSRPGTRSRTAAASKSDRSTLSPVPSNSSP